MMGFLSVTMRSRKKRRDDVSAVGTNRLLMGMAESYSMSVTRSVQGVNLPVLKLTK